MMRLVDSWNDVTHHTDTRECRPPREWQRHCKVGLIWCQGGGSDVLHTMCGNELHTMCGDVRQGAEPICGTTVCQASRAAPLAL